jgi:hypothetical protein
MNEQPNQPRADRSGDKDAEDGEAGGRAYIPGFTLGATSAARDPLERYAEIVKDPDLTNEQKDFLLQVASRRFRNRQRMAYVSLCGIVATLGVVLLGAVIDGLVTGSTIVASLMEAANLLGITNALFTAVVGAYFGVTSFRPSS